MKVFNIILFAYSFIYSIVLLTFIILTRQDLYDFNDKFIDLNEEKNCFLEKICQIPFFENICDKDCLS